MKLPEGMHRPARKHQSQPPSTQELQSVKVRHSVEAETRGTERVRISGKRGDLCTLEQQQA